MRRESQLHGDVHGVELDRCIATNVRMFGQLTLYTCSAKRHECRGR